MLSSSAAQRELDVATLRAEAMRWQLLHASAAQRHAVVEAENSRCACAAIVHISVCILVWSDVHVHTQAAGQYTRRITLCAGSNDSSRCLNVAQPDGRPGIDLTSTS